MKLPILLLAFALTAAGATLYSADASAQATRTWVSGVGDDANPCSRTAPCKTFAGAITKTAAGGAINVLDPAGFGGVTITKSITLSAEGVEGGVLVGGSNAIVVSAGASDRVVLRGLDIDGIGTGINGIRFLSGGSLSVENCVIRNFNGAADSNGILFAPSGASRLSVVDTIVSNNGIGQMGSGGITVAPTGGGSADVVFSSTHVLGNQSGVRIDSSGTSGAIRASIEDSVVSGNLGNGTALIGSGVTAQVTRSTLSNNGFQGLRAIDGAAIRVGGSSVYGNLTGVFAKTGGQIISFGDNYLGGNTSDGAPTSVVARK